MYEPWLRPDIIFRNTKKGREAIEGIKVMHKISNQVITDIIVAHIKLLAYERVTNYFQLIKAKREKRAKLKVETIDCEDVDEFGNFDNYSQ